MEVVWPAPPSTPEQQAKYEAAVSLSAEAIADAREKYIAGLQAQNAA